MRKFYLLWQTSIFGHMPFFFFFDFTSSGKVYQYRKNWQVNPILLLLLSYLLWKVLFLESMCTFSHFRLDTLHSCHSAHRQLINRSITLPKLSEVCSIYGSINLSVSQSTNQSPSSTMKFGSCSSSTTLFPLCMARTATWVLSSSRDNRDRSSTSPSVAAGQCVFVNIMLHENYTHTHTQCYSGTNARRRKRAPLGGQPHGTNARRRHRAPLDGRLHKSVSQSANKRSCYCFRFCANGKLLPTMANVVLFAAILLAATAGTNAGKKKAGPPSE